jgi:hypothetical protein
MAFRGPIFMSNPVRNFAKGDAFFSEQSTNPFEAPLSLPAVDPHYARRSFLIGFVNGFALSTFVAMPVLGYLYYLAHVSETGHGHLLNIYYRVFVRVQLAAGVVGHICLPWAICGGIMHRRRSSRHIVEE